MSLAPTRGEQALPTGLTPKILASRTKRSLKSMREKIEQLSAPWIDVDPMVDFALDDLLAAFDKFEAHVNDSVKYLQEPAP